MRQAVLIPLCIVLLAAAGCGGSESDSQEGGALEGGKTYDAVVETNKGPFTIRLDTESSPKTAGAWAKLARDGYFDGTIFHRIVPGFVIQGGDPTGTGTGGPDEKTVEPPPSDTRYTKGLVAMAKAATEAPGTAGSQFFVVTGETVNLPPEYAVLGRVTDGLDVVEQIGELGDPSTEEPTERVEIEQVTIESE